MNQQIEVDKAHTDANAVASGTFFSIDFPKKAYINGMPYDLSGEEVQALAPFSGKISDTNKNANRPGGRQVNILKDSGDFEVHLLHLDKVLVRKHARVKQGQPVGIVGNTGTATTGPHLHMTVVYKGNGASNVPELTKLQMEGLLLKQYQTSCGPMPELIKTEDSYYVSTNVCLPAATHPVVHCSGTTPP